ncbi:glycoside hydrolase family 43 protein [Spirosoma endophyticum]|uniref:Glycosyl hydrolases family 43 n=1 Tax=Spirosoma endophyticum TaxID=662367 RepID=A0A1I1QRF7_9BACT|nr:glycoside hydrolase family 43 protein [Spirosoma endophyticum]SFD24714.1 Glycosyl hydrolases family 43 [Spirosoma endophyticum]
MKKALLSLSVICLLVGFRPLSNVANPTKNSYLFAYFKGNGEDGLHFASSTDGLTWTSLKNDQSFLKPAVGQDKLMRDPCITQGPDGTFHMVWTVSWKEKGIGYASSKDLIHWSEQRYVPLMEHEPNAKNCWAPEIFYDEATRQYFIFWATSIPGRYPATDNESQPGSKASNRNHRIYYVTSKDLKTFTKAKLFYDHGFSVIDATLMKDGKRYVMFLKDETDQPFTPQKNLHVAFSDKAEGPYSKPSTSITGDFWAEGPTVLKIGNEWTVYFDRYRDHRYGAIQSTDLEHWTDVSDKIHFPAGVRHGTAFPVSEDVLKALK